LTLTSTGELYDSNENAGKNTVIFRCFFGGAGRKYRFFMF
jgi:hypothetical protein